MTARQFDPALLEARCLACGSIRFLDELLEVRSRRDPAEPPRYVCRPGLEQLGDPRCFSYLGPASDVAIASGIPAPASTR